MNPSRRPRALFSPQLGLALVLLLALTAGCAGGVPFRRLAPSPHERYADALGAAGLDGTALARDWVQAAEQALQNSVSATTPFSETGYFTPGSASAIAYRLELRRGRRLVVQADFDSATAGQLFVDLFHHRTDGSRERAASASPEQRLLEYDVRRDGTYLLRVQPELLRGGRFTLVERTVSTLSFPVSGLTAHAIRSVFGDDRDGGVRDHQGVDIFAPRGTPVVAVIDGFAQTGTNNLGGNVVWLRGLTGPSYYYAHLDRWAEAGTGRVRAGDVLGYVGNTGNARSTPPHLHFGIYDGGAINPLPFLEPDDEVPDRAVVTGVELGGLGGVTLAKTTLRGGPAAGAVVSRLLDRDTLLRVLGATGTELRVSLPDETSGYVAARAVSAVTTLRRQTIDAGTVLRERPVVAAPAVELVAADIVADVLGTFDDYLFVRAGENQGWVSETSSRRSR